MSFGGTCKRPIIPQVYGVYKLRIWHNNNNGLFRLLNVCGQYRVADIDLWPISTFAVADIVFYVADMVVADMVCGRYRCNSCIRLKSSLTWSKPLIKTQTWSKHELNFNFAVSVNCVTTVINFNTNFATPFLLSSLIYTGWPFALISPFKASPWLLQAYISDG